MFSSTAPRYAVARDAGFLARSCAGATASGPHDRDLDAGESIRKNYSNFKLFGPPVLPCALISVVCVSFRDLEKLGGVAKLKFHQADPEAHL